MHSGIARQGIFPEKVVELQFLIAGGGTVGSRMAVFLSHRGEKVTLIDADSARCEWVSKHSDAVVYRGNALDPAILSEAEVSKADCLIVALGNDQIARELVRLAKSQFGVPKVIAVAKDAPTKEKMEKLGAEFVVCTEDVVLDEIKGLLQRKSHRTLHSDRSGEFKIEQVTVRATSGMLGKDVSALGNGLAQVAGVVRAGALVFPKAKMALQMGDEVIVMGEGTAVDKVCSRIEE
jgi:trk system potassium uptake protein TrkA